ncbi:uncharacterized protein BXZ73DRAFT_100623 [Epithele typhae]|uniref:uncharacterized protein n=1 Tax=Epithele typhae TaxID=378194 RepID=UPI002007E7AF|nr:uncharacterized protein BXZ73DRAFT_100623 [Epithele typhae]KAH9935237.1 hypothetical protein BXZ73DRAFT_100623 [Epithele typhae]
MSGLLVGAFTVCAALPAAHAAPVPLRMELAPVPRMFTPRQCHAMGCLIAVNPVESESTTDTTGSTAFPSTSTLSLSQIDAGDALQAIAQALGFTWTGLARADSTSSSDSTSSPDTLVATSFAAAVVEAEAEAAPAITVDGLVPPADDTTSEPATSTSTEEADALV